LRKILGLLIPHFKNTAEYVPEEIPIPKEVKMPMRMHMGSPAKPVVGVGDCVKVGQMIGEADGKVSSPIHASVSGKIKSIDDLDSLTGRKTISITIASDGEQTLYEGITPQSVTNEEQFLEAVKNSGVVGLGGAGYPIAPQLMLDGAQLDYILINGAECEPYITSDTRTMLDEAGYVFEGALFLKEYIKPKSIVICIEENKPEAIKRMQELSADVSGIEVSVLPSSYPQGERTVLIYNITGRIVPDRKPDICVGCLVLNCTTVAAIAKYIKTGIPLVSKCVTVDGSAVINPKNIIVPIGTPLRELFDFCGLREDVKKVILGGPMMGAAVPNLDVPVVKVTNAVLAFSARDADPPAPSACIKCGRCIEKCPMNLMPSLIEGAFELKKIDLLRKLMVNMCLECGCCAYVCPAKRPLIQVMNLSKSLLREAG